MQSSGEVLRSEYCFARVFPSATGLTASKCEGLGNRDTSISEPSYDNVGDAARRDFQHASRKVAKESHLGD